MRKLIIFAFIGFLAQLIDGSLGMAYGVTSTSMLLTFGIAPAVASASVHFAEVVTTAASGVSHMKFGNVDKQALFKLIIPGSIGAFAGACFLSNLHGDIVKPYISLFLLILGVYVLFRFMLLNPVDEKKSIDMSRKKSIYLGAIAGFADATGGGGWGPITTPVLLSQNRVAARKVVGTVDTSEFAIAVSASLGFLIALGWQEVNWFWVIALMAGGIIAAPIAAWIVTKLPSYLLGVLVGGFIILTNARTLMNTWFIHDYWSPVIYLLILIGWSVSLAMAIRKNKKSVPQYKYRGDYMGQQENIYHHSFSVTKELRQALHGHKSYILWFTGLSGSGKSTIANMVEGRLHKKGISTYILDGDNLRKGLNEDLGFSSEDRKENIRRIGEVAKIFVDSGIVVLATFISPYASDRDDVRKKVHEGEFLEIYVKCPLEACEKRDPKGLYKKARIGEITHFTGISAPYEEPVNPEIIIETSQYSIEECVLQIINFLKDNEHLGIVDI